MYGRTCRRDGKIGYHLRPTHFESEDGMKGLDGKEQTILRGNIKSLVCTNHSLMPMGFEQAMSKQELADLIAYLQPSH